MRTSNAVPATWSTKPPNVLRISSKDAGGGVRARDLADTAIESVNRSVIDGKDDGRGNEGTDGLRDRIRQDLAPGELAMNGERNGDGWIQVRTGNAPGDIDAHGDSESPGEVNGDDVSGSASAEDDLGDNTGAECDQDEGAKELGGEFASERGGEGPLRGLSCR